MPGYFSLDAKLKCSTKSMGRLRRVGVEDSEIIMTTLHVKISQITKTTIIATRSYFSSSMLTDSVFSRSHPGCSNFLAIEACCIGVI